MKFCCPGAEGVRVEEMKTDHLHVKNEIRWLGTEWLEDPQMYHFWYEKMPPERKKKIDRFRFDKDKRLSLAAGILLVTGLSDLSGLSQKPFSEFSDPILELGKYGKPYIAGRENLFFNLSHSGRMAACSFSDRSVGVDIEENRHFEETLIRYVFLEEEREAFLSESGLQGESPHLICTRMWTIKESLMKYYGTGISLGPKQIRIDAMDSSGDSDNKGKVYSRVTILGDQPAVDRPKEKEDIYITSWDLEGYQLSVCSGYEEYTDQPVQADQEIISRTRTGLSGGLSGIQVERGEEIEQ